MFSFSHKPEKQLEKDDAEDTEGSANVKGNCAFGSAISEQLSAGGNMRTTFRDISEQTLFKGSADLDGLPFTIDNCTDSVFVLLDHLATLTIEKCNNCVIICGPCRGSVFMRNCSNCLLLAACQQFRLQNSHDIEAHLHCNTKPTIEDSDLIVAPLLMHYDGFNEDMKSAMLAKRTNLWDKVQNFTPDMGQCQRMPFDPFANGAISSEVVSDELLEKLSTFMEKPEARELSLGPS